MERINNLASKALSSASGQKQNAGRIDSRAADAVWVAFAEMFGAKLTSQFGDEPPFMWRKALSGMTREQINRGLDWLRSSGKEWPPSLPEFEAACAHPIGKPAGYYRELPHDPPETKEHRQARKERGREEMAKVRAALRGRS